MPASGGKVDPVPGAFGRESGTLVAGSAGHGDKG